MRAVLLFLALSAAADPLWQDNFAVTAPSKMRVNIPFEAVLDLPTDYADPLDPTEIRIDATIECPSRTVTVPCYYDVPVTRGLERLDPGGVIAERLELGPPRWKLRFTAMQEGWHTIRLVATDRRGSVSSRPFRRMADRPRTPGYIRFDPGTPFPHREYHAPRPVIGTNLCWAGPAGSYDYDTWLTRMGGSGIDFARLWLWSPTRTFDLEAPTAGHWGWDFGHAWRLEYVIDRGLTQGLNFVLALTVPSSIPRADSPAWPTWPYAQAAGGPLAQPGDFYRDATVRELTRRRLRYLLARYGGYPNVSAFEVAARCERADAAQLDWMREMAGWLREHDVAHRLICASAAGDDARREMAAAHVADVVTAELPSPDDVPAAVRAAVRAADHPTLISGYGYADRTKEVNDAAGYRLHDGLWSGILSGGLGVALPWWWDSQVHRRDLYSQFHAVRTLTEAIDWHAFKPLDACLAGDWRVAALTGPGQVLAWVYPPPGTQNRPAALIVPGTGWREVKATVYDPWTEHWQSAPVACMADGWRIGLPRTIRDVVVRVRYR